MTTPGHPERSEGSAAGSRQRRAFIGWVVDAQNDFMLKQLPGGRLFVRQLHDPNDLGAEQIIPALSRAVALYHRRCDQVTYTGDWHHKDDAEIDPIAPDPMKGTYPLHCMGMSDDPIERAGAELVLEVRPAQDLLVLERDVAGSPARQVALDSVRTRRSVFIQKHEFSVFTGAPGAEEYIAGLEEALDAELVIVVCGVATDVCVKHAIDGFLARHYSVILLTDATYGLGLEDSNGLVAEWQRRGLIALTVDQFEDMSIS
jgi:nicotinamidase-related amidase